MKREKYDVSLERIQSEVDKADPLDLDDLSGLEKALSKVVNKAVAEQLHHMLSFSSICLGALDFKRARVSFSLPDRDDWELDVVCDFDLVEEFECSLESFDEWLCDDDDPIEHLEEAKANLTRMIELANAEISKRKAKR